MCGISGFFTHSPKGNSLIDVDTLLRVRDQMVSRGPDGSGVWLSDDGRIGFAHRRLAIIDLSSDGAQPMTDYITKNTIVFNGEIYNFRELRDELSRAGHCFHSNSDTEVLLKLYTAYGQEMVHKLRGMYTFAIRDYQKNCLFLARDPFGIKPLYYADDGESFYFASQVKAILKFGKIETTPSPAGQVGFFIWGHVPEPFTMYKNVRALHAGSCLWVDGSGRIDQKKFFDIASEISKISNGCHEFNPKEAAEFLQNAMVDTVKHHNIADVPVGVFLSSGIDSATLAALSSEGFRKNIDSERLTAVTLGFDEYKGTNNDEIPIAAAIANYYGAKHISRTVTQEEFSERLSALLSSMDQPSIDGINTYFVSLAAKEAGLKVAISGLGADELFGGYSSFIDVPLMVNIFKHTSKFPKLGRGFRSFAFSSLGGRLPPKLPGLIEYGGTFSGAYLLRRGLYMPWELNQVLDSEIVREGWEELQVLSSLDDEHHRISNPRLKVSALEMSRYMLNQLLRDTDWASMAHSIEVRVPFVDVVLFRNVLKVIHVCGQIGKKDMARTPMKPLPDYVLNRKKTGFSVPTINWYEKLIGHQSSERGLRSWARFLHKEFLNS